VDIKKIVASKSAGAEVITIAVSADAAFSAVTLSVRAWF